MDMISRQKSALRQAMAMVRDRLSDEDIQSRSLAVARNLLGIPAIAAARHVFVYVAFRSEVRTQAIIQALLDGEKQVSVPTVCSGGRVLRAARLGALRDLVPNALGIPEPRPEALQITAPGELDAALVPGLAFDVRGWRIGYGGGYYDRFLREVRLRTWGLAFDLQVLDAVPHSSDRDVPVEHLVTETRVVTCG